MTLRTTCARGHPFEDLGTKERGQKKVPEKKVPDRLPLWFLSGRRQYSGGRNTHDGIADNADNADNADSADSAD
jgi:hypothetical protein